MERLNIENFEEVANREKGVFIIKFFSPTCGPCHTMVQVMEALDQNNPAIPIYEVDTMESPEIASHFFVKGVPHIAFCENREVLYTFTGLTPLHNLQYVLDNIDDTYFRINGTFRQPEIKKSYWYEISIALVLAFLIGMIFFYRP